MHLNNEIKINDSQILDYYISPMIIEFGHKSFIN